jgi:hypothetical protein
LVQGTYETLLSTTISPLAKRLLEAKIFDLVRSQIGSYTPAPAWTVQAGREKLVICSGRANKRNSNTVVSALTTFDKV